MTQKHSADHEARLERATLKAQKLGHTISPNEPWKPGSCCGDDHCYDVKRCTRCHYEVKVHLGMTEDRYAIQGLATKRRCERGAAA